MTKRIIIAGMGDTGVLTATQLAKRYEVIGISTKPALVSGQELGMRMARPEKWQQNYLIPLDRYRKLDRVAKLHGRVASVDFDARKVHVAHHDDAPNESGALEEIEYDALIVATGVSSGFWRGSAVRSLKDIEEQERAVRERVEGAKTVAVIGAGPSGSSVARNLARRFRDKEVSLFYPHELPLNGYHPKTRERATALISEAGAHLFPGHRAEVPGTMPENGLSEGVVHWKTGQEPVEADLVVWTVGDLTPNTEFMPDDSLDERRFVAVDEFLRVRAADHVFAIGDVAATDPLRSSARNWAYRLLARNVRATLEGNESKLKAYKPPEHRWGSIFGPEEGEGLRVFSPTGGVSRIPEWVERTIITPVITRRFIYGGVRRDE